MRSRTLVVLIAVLLIMGVGCRECGCGGDEHRDQATTPDQAAAPAIPESSTSLQQNMPSVPSSEGEAPKSAADAPQPVGVKPNNVPQALPVPEVTYEELHDPSFNAKLPLVSRKSLIILRKLQESGQIRRPNVPASTGIPVHHDDHVKQAP